MKRILILEDHQPLAQALADLLHHMYKPVSIQLFERLEDLKANGLDADLLISDLRLPDSDAINTAHFLLEHAQSIQIVCHSAARREGLLLSKMSLGLIMFLEKGEDQDWAKELMSLQV